MSVRVAFASRSSHIGMASCAASLLALAAAPFWGGRDDLQLLSEVYTYVALASLWNLLAGYAGLVSVGQQAYVGLGAYVLFAFAILAGLSPLWAIPLAGIIAAIVAMPVAGLVFRLRGHYFAIGTWIIAEVFRLLASQVSVLGGGSGISLPASLVIAIASTRQWRDFIDILDRACACRRGAGSDLAAPALALRTGAQGDPRQRARGGMQRHRRAAHQGAGLYHHGSRHGDGRRASSSCSGCASRRTPHSASTTGLRS